MEAHLYILKTTHDTVNKIAQNDVLIISNIYNPGQKAGFWDTSPFLRVFCMEFAVNLQYTLLNTALTRFFPHRP